MPETDIAASPPLRRPAGRKPRAEAIRLAALAAGIVLVLAALAGPLLLPHAPDDTDLAHALAPPLLFGGSWDHPLGTDGLGRDLLSRLVAGARVSLAVSAAVVLAAGAAGSLLGLVAGYRGGAAEAVISRLADIFQAMPLLLMAMAVAGALGPGVRTLVFAASVMTWPVYTRVLRAEVLRLRGLEFVTAARGLGAGGPRILFRHILPNAAGPLLVLATLQFSAAVVLEASLSFLRLGVQPPQASWGSMLAEGRDYLGVADVLVVAPAAAIVATCLVVGVLGDWLAAPPRR